MKLFRNLRPPRQKELERQFPWLHRIHEFEQVPLVRHLSISVFDHWLSHEEAEKQLDGISREEQLRRDTQQFEFCQRLVEQAELVHFKFRGRGQDKPRFRSFTSRSAAIDYFCPRTLGGSRRRKFQVLLPAYGAVFYEGYDDTSHLYFTEEQGVEPFCHLVREAGLHVLPNG